MAAVIEFFCCPVHGVFAPANLGAILPLASQVIDFIKVRIIKNI